MSFQRQFLPSLCLHQRICFGLFLEKKVVNQPVKMFPSDLGKFRGASFGKRLQLKDGFRKAFIRAERERMLLPQHPGALDKSVATTSKHVGIFQLLRSSVGSLPFKCVCRQLQGVTERVVGTETLWAARGSEPNFTSNLTGYETHWIRVLIVLTAGLHTAAAAAAAPNTNLYGYYCHAHTHTDARTRSYTRTLTSFLVLK